MSIAICIICYNRPDSLRRVFGSIERGCYDGDKVDLIVSIDYSGRDDVRNVADQLVWSHGDKRIVAYRHNLGLRSHVLKCGEFTKEYDGLIVLEDDVFVAPSFYLYARACVEKYSSDDRIAGVSLYSFGVNYHNMLPFVPLRSESDVYLMQNAQSWGQVWMTKQWSEFIDWYGNNNGDFHEMPHLPKSICSWKKSWLKYHTRYCIERDKFFVYPYVSLSTCFSDEGEHTAGASTIVQVPLLHGVKRDYRLSPSVCYDSFFENVNLADFFGFADPEELCVDIYGEKDNRQERRYWLTRKIADYRILHSYGLRLKPVEQNIFNEVSGTDVFLYDVSESSPNRIKHSPFGFEQYLYNDFSGIKKSSKILFGKILKRLRNR